MRLSFYRGLGIGAIMLLVSILLFSRLDLILKVAGFDRGLTDYAHKGIIWMIPYIILQNFNENLRSYMIVLDFHKIFNVTNFLDISLGTFFGWLFVWHLDLGLIGVGISRFITEATTTSILLFTWKKYGMDGSFRKGETLKEIFVTKKFWNFAKFWLANSLPGYAEYIMIEIMVLFAGAYNNDTIIGSWVCLQSVVGLMFMLGVGSGDTGRVFVGYQLGKLDFRFAKKLAYWSCLLSFLS